MNKRKRVCINEENNTEHSIETTLNHRKARRKVMLCDDSVPIEFALKQHKKRTYQSRAEGRLFLLFRKIGIFGLDQIDMVDQFCVNIIQKHPLINCFTLTKEHLIEAGMTVSLANTCMYMINTIIH